MLKHFSYCIEKKQLLLAAVFLITKFKILCTKAMIQHQLRFIEKSEILFF